MNSPILKPVIFLVFLMLGFFVGTKLIADDHPKPESKIEFGISKHAGLHYVNGGFDVESVKFGKFEAGVYTEVKAVVNINSLWTWQADASAHDDPGRTKDLLSDSWFDAKKFPKASAYIKWLPLNDADNVVIVLKIKGIERKINAKVRDGLLKFRIVLNDFKINASWKKIFAGNYADVVVKLEKK